MKKCLELFLRDIYEGIYFISRKYESRSESRFATHLRFVVAFFIYYFSLLLLFLSIKVATYGPFKINFIEALFYLFGIFSCIYIVFINPLLDKSMINEYVDISVKKRKIKKANLFQILSVFCLIVSFLIGYILYKK